MVVLILAFAYAKNPPIKTNQEKEKTAKITDHKNNRAKAVNDITHHDLFIICDDLNYLDLTIQEEKDGSGYLLIIQARGKKYVLVTALKKRRSFKKLETLTEYVKSIPVKNKTITIKLQKKKNK